MVTEIVTAVHIDLRSCTEGHAGEQSLETKNRPHYLCKQLACGHQICVVGALDRGATTAWDLTYFSGVTGVKMDRNILGKPEWHKS